MMDHHRRGLPHHRRVARPIRTRAGTLRIREVVDVVDRRIGRMQFHFARSLGDVIDVGRRSSPRGGPSEQTPALDDYSFGLSGGLAGLGSFFFFLASAALSFRRTGGTY